MSDDSTKNEDDAIFLAEMTGVTRLKPDNRIKFKKKPNKVPRRESDESHHFVIDDCFSTAEMVEECPEVLSFSRSGLQHKVLKKLRTGKQDIELVLDLHGLTVIEARNELLEFLGECEVSGIRNVIIIHGKGFRSKGKAVIKPMLNRWLRSTDIVLAFHSAQPKDGGAGAVYVLLKNFTVDR